MYGKDMAFVMKTLEEVSTLSQLLLDFLPCLLCHFGLSSSRLSTLRKDHLCYVVKRLELTNVGKLVLILMLYFNREESEEWDDSR